MPEQPKPGRGIGRLIRKPAAERTPEEREEVARYLREKDYHKDRLHVHASQELIQGWREAAKARGMKTAPWVVLAVQNYLRGRDDVVDALKAELVRANERALDAQRTMAETIRKYGDQHDLAARIQAYLTEALQINQELRARVAAMDGRRSE
ncbi:MAG: hypothetical protein QOD77_1880 [Thermoplasmata archaeon]|jgi:hypothetical protein|nr:hypothetical protein [Thermoplasmata archaeon]